MKILNRCLLAFAIPALVAGADKIVYQNDFNWPLDSAFPEWSSSGYKWTGNSEEGTGPQRVTNVDSPNHAQRFLGEFGGPKIVNGPPFVRVNETVTLSLKDLPRHTQITVSFDLYILKSWDGNNSIYGPDRFTLGIGDGLVLLNTTFSNNPKTGADHSPQNYPKPASVFQTGAIKTNSLGYNFYGDAIYKLQFTFPHNAQTLSLNFSSSLFEGKGADDESWGLDNVIVTVGEGPKATFAR